MNESIIKLICKCGLEFERPKRYVEFNREQPKIIVFKWKLEYCDKCYDNRVKKASKRLPEILKSLAT